MFHQELILLISRKKVCVFEKGTLNCFTVKDWSTKGLQQFLGLLSKYGKQNIKLFFDTTLSYHLFLESKDKAQLKTDITKQVPENIDQVWWYWHEGKILVLSDVASQLLIFLLEKKYQVSAAGSSQSMAHIFGKKEKLALLIYQINQRLEFSLIKNGNIHFSESIALKQDPADILKRLAKVAADDLKEKIEVVIFFGETLPNSLSSYKNKLDIQLHKLNWGRFFSFENKWPRQKQVVEDKNQIEETQEPESQENFWSRNKNLVPLLGVLLILFLLMLSVIYWRFFSSASKKPDIVIYEPTSLEEVMEISPSPSPKLVLEEPKFVPSLYTIEILNGSGLSGAASQVVDLLVQNNYDDFETGNADNFDYTKTQVITEYTNLRENLVEILEANNYEVETLNTSTGENVDARIIVGNK